ncbi:hypothetical protein H0H81_001319, partial [Sphagnurus paluster]
MSHTARFSWTRAFENAADEMELPLGCPLDMTEPQYARLLFDDTCYACLSKGHSQIYFSLRLRLCSGCSKTNLVTGDVIEAVHWIGLDEQERGAWEPMLWSLLPCVVHQHDQGSSKTNTEQGTYSVSEFMQVAKEYAALRGSGDDKARKQYIADRQAIATALIH